MSGTVNTVMKFGTTTSGVNSQIKDNGTSVGIGVTTLSSSYLFEVNKSASTGNAIRATSGTPTGGNTGAAAIYGQSSTGRGVYGFSQSDNGVLGQSQDNFYGGVAGTNNNAGPGIWGENMGTGWSGYFSGTSGKGIRVVNGSSYFGTSAPPATPTSKLQVEGGTAVDGISSTTAKLSGSGSLVSYDAKPAAIRGEYLGIGANDGTGVVGIATSGNNFYGVGVWGKGKYYGVAGIGMTGAHAGGYFYANGASYALYSDGNFYLNGNFSGTGVNSYSSDRKLKKNIHAMSNALNIINKIKPSTYEFRVGEIKGMYLPEGKHYGVIAQELQEVLPELVLEQNIKLEDENGKHTIDYEYLSVNYNELIPILIKGMQEQQEQINAQQKEIDALKAIINKK